MQIEKPWIIEECDFIKCSKDWYKEKFAVFSADALLCAFVWLRLLGNGVFEFLSPNRQDVALNHLYKSVTLISLLNADLRRWEVEWLPVFANGDYIRVEDDANTLNGARPHGSLPLVSHSFLL